MESEFEKPEITTKNEISIRYSDSTRYDYGNFIHKYFLAPEDKAKL